MRIRPSFSYPSIAALVLASAALAACGGDDDDNDSAGSPYSGTKSSATTERSSSGTAAGGAGEKLAIDAVEDGPGQYSFSKPKLTANAGKVSVVMTNPAGNQAPHAVEVEGNGVEESGQVVTAGGTSTATADLKPGEYAFYCPVDDHRADGMEGTLTVR